MATQQKEQAPKDIAIRLLEILRNDRRKILDRIDDYIRGEHDSPYMPDTADAEYQLLAERAVSNWMPLVLNTSCQALAVDNYRRGAKKAGKGSKEWDHWDRSRMAARQKAVYRGALSFGHSFVLTEKNAAGFVVSKGLSALKTTALFEDPANDLVPYAALTVDGGYFSEPDHEGEMKFRLWIGAKCYIGTEEKGKINLDGGSATGTTGNPITRFAAQVDLEGRTTGVIEPLIPLQNRINQTVFDLLVAQTYGSFNVRTVTGMAPPMRLEPEWSEYEQDGVTPTDNAVIVGSKVALDPNTGNPIPADVNLSAKRFLFAEDSDVEFGSLPATPLGGFIESIEMSVRHLAATSQTPPHHLLGQIANLSAEALDAAEMSLSRMIDSFKAVFGEAWEQVFRNAAELEGDGKAQEDLSGEVIWRDMGNHSLAQNADALGKMRESLEIPARGLWPRIPGITKEELDSWEELADNADTAGQIASAQIRATTPVIREPAPTPAA